MPSTYRQGRGRTRLTALVVTQAAALLMTTAAAAGSNYLEPVTFVPRPDGCHRLTAGINGVKVKLVQRRLGFPATYWESYDGATMSAVKRFKVSRGLPANGITGRSAWRAMGFDASFCLDRYRAPIQVPAGATNRERAEQLVDFARAWLGVEYVWGGGGPKRIGVDCSGLVLQALYSAGLNPRPITLDKHILPAYRTSRQLFAHPGLRHRPLSDVQLGDLVFWKRKSDGQINHVAIAIGGNQVIEASSGAGRVWVNSIGHRSTQWVVQRVVRPFPYSADASG